MRVGRVTRKLGWMLVAWVVFLDSPHSYAKNEIGRLASFRGEVKIDGRSVQIGRKIYGDSEVITQDGQATLMIGRESLVQVGPETHFSIKAFLARSRVDGTEKARFKVNYGKIRAIVKTQSTGIKKDYRFESRTAVMGIRGTQIMIDNPADRSDRQQFLTIEGRATVTLPKETQVSGESRPVRRVSLSQNDSLSAGGDSGAPPARARLDRDDVENLIRVVGPRMGAPRTQDEMIDIQEGRGSPRDNFKFDNRLIRPPSLNRPRILFDPVANTTGDSRINATLKKQ